jgi:hypothetical protein
MTVKELIERLQECDPDSDVQIEQTNDNGPEGVTAITYDHGVVVLEGDLFR